MTLTHSLIYNKKTDRWACQCGYVLGTGRKGLYARCPLAKKRRPENRITPQQHFLSKDGKTKYLVSRNFPEDELPLNQQQKGPHENSKRDRRRNSKAKKSTGKP
jgi:hypothetical protein